MIPCAVQAGSDRRVCDASSKEYWYAEAMNKPSDASTFRPNIPLYEDDAYGWAMYQAELIRERQADMLDWDNIAEEIESVGKSERRSLQSNLVQIILHMLKWDVQPERRGRSWFASINSHRDDAQDDLRQNSSLKPQLDSMVRDALIKARRRAADQTGEPRKVFEALIYDTDAVFNREHDLPDDV
jgi:Domain of unknown function DUF29